MYFLSFNLRRHCGEADNFSPRTLTAFLPWRIMHCLHI